MTVERNRKTRKLVASTVIGIVVVAVLSACSPGSGIRARLGDDGIEFVFCRATDSDTLTVSEVDPELREDDVAIWTLSGGDGIEAGQQIVYGQVPEGWNEEFGPIAPDPESESISIAVGGPDGVRVATFVAGSLGPDWRSETSSVDPADPCG